MGEDVESILHKLYMESGQDIERCQRGIVYLDEIDKVGGGTVSYVAAPYAVWYTVWYIVRSAVLYTVWYMVRSAVWCMRGTVCGEVWYVVWFAVWHVIRYTVSYGT